MKLWIDYYSNSEDNENEEEEEDSNDINDDKKSKKSKRKFRIKLTKVEEEPPQKTKDDYIAQIEQLENELQLEQKISSTLDAKNGEDACNINSIRPIAVYGPFYKLMEKCIFITITIY